MTVGVTGVRSLYLSVLNKGLSGFDEGSPDGNDPLQLARLMASRGITLVRLGRVHSPKPLH